MDFGCLVYVKCWIQCSGGIDFPYNDLQLYKSILQYRDVDIAVAESALKRHLWYVKEELAVLSLLSSRI